MPRLEGELIFPLSLEYLLYQHQLRWASNICRMAPYRLPRQLLYSELQQGQRSAGRPKKCFADVIKSVLRLNNIAPDSLEHMVTERTNWRSTCTTGLDAWAEVSSHRAEERRQYQHTIASTVPAGLACQQCGRNLQIWAAQSYAPPHQSQVAVQSSSLDHHYYNKHHLAIFKTLIRNTINIKCDQAAEMGNSVAEEYSK